MFEIIFTTIIPLALLLGVTFFIAVTLHELGHAIPALLMTDHDVTIYIGSIGDPYKSFSLSRGRLTIFIKYNPLLWFKGCCFTYDYDLTLNARILLTAGGPIASILGTLGSWYLLSATEQIGFFRIISGSVFVVSLLITLSTTLPIARVRYTPAGQAVYNDSIQILRLIRMKYR